MGAAQSLGVHFLHLTVIRQIPVDFDLHIRRLGVDCVGHRRGERWCQRGAGDTGVFEGSGVNGNDASFETPFFLSATNKFTFLKHIQTRDHPAEQPFLGTFLQSLDLFCIGHGLFLV